jgi:hypothetical protein
VNSVLQLDFGSVVSVARPDIGIDSGPEMFATVPPKVPPEGAASRLHSQQLKRVLYVAWPENFKPNKRMEIQL